jgi:hypothetical protein
MKVFELLSELKDHRPNAPVVISEIDAAPTNLFIIESIIKEDNKCPLLMVRRIPTTLTR